MKDETFLCPETFEHNSNTNWRNSMNDLSFHPSHQIACNSPERQVQKRRKKAKTKSIEITKTDHFSLKRRETISATFARCKKARNIWHYMRLSGRNHISVVKQKICEPALPPDFWSLWNRRQDVAGQNSSGQEEKDHVFPGWHYSTIQVRNQGFATSM